MSHETNDLAGRTVVVTGASSGLGRGASVRLAAFGANVVVAARRGAVLDALVEEIESAGGVALAMICDVSSAPDVEALAARAIDSFGSIDVWINNVGIGALGYLWDVPLEDHARVLQVNLTGTFFGAHVAIRHFLERGRGVLLNIASMESKVPLVMQSSYAASKAGVLSLSRSVHEELQASGAPDTIKVGTIMPWAVDTPWWSHAANHTGRTLRMAAMDDPWMVVDAIVAACADPRLEQPVGWKARGADLSHRLFPGLTERLSAGVAQQESRQGATVPATHGSIHSPTAAGSTTVDGGIRERMAAEDASDAGATS